MESGDRWRLAILALAASGLAFAISGMALLFTSRDGLGRSLIGGGVMAVVSLMVLVQRKRVG